MNDLRISASEFHTLAARITRLAADYLTALEELPAFPAVSGADTLQAFRAPQALAGRRASRAMASAIRFAIEPPPQKLPR